MATVNQALAKLRSRTSGRSANLRNRVAASTGRYSRAVQRVVVNQRASTEAYKARIAAREKTLADLNAQFTADTSKVLNKQQLTALVDASRNAGVPSAVSYFAGYELSRASAAERQRAELDRKEKALIRAGATDKEILKSVKEQDRLLLDSQARVLSQTNAADRQATSANQSADVTATNTQTREILAEDAQAARVDAASARVTASTEAASTRESNTERRHQDNLATRRASGAGKTSITAKLLNYRPVATPGINPIATPIDDALEAPAPLAPATPIAPVTPTSGATSEQKAVLDRYSNAQVLRDAGVDAAAFEKSIIDSLSAAPQATAEDAKIGGLDLNQLESDPAKLIEVRAQAELQRLEAEAAKVKAVEPPTPLQELEKAIEQLPIERRTSALEQLQILKPEGPFVPQDEFATASENLGGLLSEQGLAPLEYSYDKYTQDLTNATV